MKYLFPAILAGFLAGCATVESRSYSCVVHRENGPFGPYDKYYIVRATSSSKAEKFLKQYAKDADVDCENED